MFKSYSDFVDNAERIYKQNLRGRQRLVQTEGIQADPVFLQKAGGIGVVFRYPSSFSDDVIAYSQQLAEQSGGVALGQALHTTIRFATANGFVFDPDRDTPIMAGLAASLRQKVATTLPYFLKESAINFSAVVYNHFAVVAPGKPNHACYTLLEYLYNAAGLLPEAMPWGAHMTLVRFSEPRLPEELAAFFDLLQTPKSFGEARPNRVDVTWSQIDEGNRLTFETFDSIPLT